MGGCHLPDPPHAAHLLGAHHDDGQLPHEHHQRLEHVGPDHGLQPTLGGTTTHRPSPLLAARAPSHPHTTQQGAGAGGAVLPPGRVGTPQEAPHPSHCPAPQTTPPGWGKGGTYQGGVEGADEPHGQHSSPEVKASHCKQKGVGGAALGATGRASTGGSAEPSTAPGTDGTGPGSNSSWKHRSPHPAAPLVPSSHVVTCIEGQCRRIQNDSHVNHLPGREVTAVTVLTAAGTASPCWEPPVPHTAATGGGCSGAKLW